MSSAGAERQLFTAEASKIVAFWTGGAERDEFGRSGKATIHRRNFENSCLLADGAELEKFGMAERQLFTAEASKIVAFWLVVRGG